MPTSYRRRIEKQRLRARERRAQRRMQLEQAYLPQNVSSGNSASQTFRPNDGTLWNLPSSLSSNTALPLPSSFQPDVSNEDNRCSQVCGIKVEQELIEEERPFESFANDHKHTREVTNEGSTALWEEEIPVYISATAPAAEEQDPLALLPDGEREGEENFGTPSNNKGSDKECVIIKTELQRGEAMDFGTTSDEDNAMTEEAETEATTANPVFPSTSKGNSSSVNDSLLRGLEKPISGRRNVRTSTSMNKAPSNFNVNGNEKKSYPLRRRGNPTEFIAKRTPTSSRAHICLICDETFRSSFGLGEHYIDHGIRKEIQCQVCKRIFPTFNELRTHVDDYYFNKLTMLRVTEATSPFQCPVCDTIFVTRYGLDCHGRTHEVSEGFVCKICVQGYPSFNTLVSHMKEHKSDTYRCTICSKAFKQRETAIHHVFQKHKADFETCCEFCGEKFKTPEDLEIHKEQLHKTDIKWVNKFGRREIHKEALERKASVALRESNQPVSCQRCGTTVKKKWMKSHQASIRCRFPLRVPCQKCGKKFRNQRSLKVHEQLHTGFQCPFCPSSDCRYSRKPGLLRHLAVSHLTPEGFVELNIPPDAERNYRCKECDASYTTSKALKEHEIYHGVPAVQCSDCPQKVFTNYQLFAHKMKEHGRYKTKLAEGRSIMCHQCPSTFFSRGGYDRHKKIAHSEMPSSALCEEQTHRSDVKWGNKFETPTIQKESANKKKNSAVVQESIKEIQKQSVPSLERKASVTLCESNQLLSCQRCGTTVKKKCMKSHQASIRCRFPLRLPCQTCGKKFRGPRNLEVHQQQHLGEGFQCPFCPPPQSHYAAKASLLRHLAVSHLKPEGFVELNIPPNAERNYGCKKCNASYTTSEALKEHEIYHGIPAIQCSECPQKVFTNYQLYGHKMKEHGRYNTKLPKGRSIMCHQCPSTFFSRDGYGRHVKVAHSETPHVLCYICGKSFVFRDLLARHIRKVHSNKE